MIGFGSTDATGCPSSGLHDASIGNIEADVFDPATWKTEYPNPAFKQMDAADAFWAASIMSRFTDAMIRGVVEEARLTNPARRATWLTSSSSAATRRCAGASPERIPSTDSKSAAAGRPSWRLITPRCVSVSSTSHRSTEIVWAPYDNNAGTAAAVEATLDTAESRVAIPPDVWGPPMRSGSATPSPRSRRVIRDFRTGSSRWWSLFAIAMACSKSSVSSVRPTSQI